MLELGEDLLDWVQVWAVSWQENQPGADGSDRFPHVLSFVTAQIVENDNIAWLEGRHELLLHVGQEACGVDRTVKHAGRAELVASQGGDERQSLPMPVRHLGIQPLAARCPAPQRCHVGLGPGFVDKHQPLWVDAGLILLPKSPFASDVRTVLLAGQHAFF